MMQPRWAEMALLRPREVTELLDACPIIYVPTGIYEWHDEQNPLGTDTLKKATREQLADTSFVYTQECWKNCQNITDLQADYWQGDERWEDPCCFFCRWRSPGVVRALTVLKGCEWMQRRMVMWEEQAGQYTCRVKDAMAQLRREMEGAHQPAL